MFGNAHLATPLERVDHARGARNQAVDKAWADFDKADKLSRIELNQAIDKAWADYNQAVARIQGR